MQVASIRTEVRSTAAWYRLRCPWLRCVAPFSLPHTRFVILYSVLRKTHPCAATQMYSLRPGDGCCTRFSASYMMISAWPFALRRGPRHMHPHPPIDPRPDRNQVAPLIVFFKPRPDAPSHRLSRASIDTLRHSSPQLGFSPCAPSTISLAPLPLRLPAPLWSAFVSLHAAPQQQWLSRTVRCLSAPFHSASLFPPTGPPPLIPSVDFTK